eukprot:c3319_g1_i1.p1 GENE.c3319_g1_i1~~c3319_g1_i1.p1  ORF type:complete len:293 (+),score=50.07 c3319_g1_i1:112-990(+)
MNFQSSSRLLHELSSSWGLVQKVTPHVLTHNSPQAHSDANTMSGEVFHWASVLFSNMTCNDVFSPRIGHQAILELKKHYDLVVATADLESEIIKKADFLTGAHEFDDPLKIKVVTALVGDWGTAGSTEYRHWQQKTDVVKQGLYQRVVNDLIRHTRQLTETQRAEHCLTMFATKGDTNEVKEAKEYCTSHVQRPTVTVQIRQFFEKHIGEEKPNLTVLFRWLLHPNLDWRDIFDLLWYRISNLMHMWISNCPVSPLKVPPNRTKPPPAAPRSDIKGSMLGPSGFPPMRMRQQ